MVNDHPEGLSEALARTLASRGLGWARQNPDALADELLEKFPGQQDHVDALVATIASDVLSALIGAPGSDVGAKLLTAHADHLVSEWGLDPDVALWAVSAWSHAISIIAVGDEEEGTGTLSGSTDPSDGDHGGTRVTGAVSRLRRLRRPGTLTTRLGLTVARPEHGTSSISRGGRMPVPIPPQSEAGSLALSASDPAMPASSPPEGFTQEADVPGVSDATSPVPPQTTPSAPVQPTALANGSSEAVPVMVWSASALDVRAPEWLNRILTALSTALAVAVKHRLVLLGSLATLAAVATVIATTPPPPESASRAPTASPARSASGGSGVPTPTAGSVSSTATASGETSAALASPSPKEMTTVSVDELVAASWDRDWVEAIRVLQEYLGTRGGSDAYASGKLYDALVQYGIVLVGLQQPADAIDTWKQAEALDAGRPEAPQRISALSARLAGQGAEEAQTAEVAVTATAISSPTPRVSVTASPVRGLGTPSPVRATETPVEAPEAVDVPVPPAPSVTKAGPAGAVSRSQAPTQTVRSTATAVVRLTVTPKPTASPAPTSTNRPAPTAPPVPTATVPPPPTAPPLPTATKVPVPTAPPAPTATQPPASTPVPAATVVLQRIVLEQPAQDFVTTAGASVEFRWKQVPGARKYRVQMCLADDCWQDLRLERITDQVSMSYAPDRSGAWMWRVAAIGDNDRLGPWPEFLRRFSAN